MSQRIPVSLRGRLEDETDRDMAYGQIDLSKGRQLFSCSPQVRFFYERFWFRGGPSYHLRVIGPVDEVGCAEAVEAIVRPRGNGISAMVIQKWGFEFCPETGELWKVPSLDLIHVGFELVPTQDAPNPYGENRTAFWSREILRALGLVERCLTPLQEPICLNPFPHYAEGRNVVMYLSDLEAQALEYQERVAEVISGLSAGKPHAEEDGGDASPGAQAP